MYFSFLLLTDIDTEVSGSQINVKSMLARWLAIRKSLIYGHLWQTWQSYTWS